MDINRYTQIQKLIDNVDFIKFFDEELLKYITKITNNVIDKHKALKNLYLNNTFTYSEFILKNSCEGHIKIWKNGRFCWKHGVSGYMSGKTHRGKKRPEHSLKMKIKMLGIDRGDNFRKLKNEQNKSINFKISFLKNKNIDIDYTNDDLVISEYCKQISDLRKAPSYKIKLINNFLKSKKYYNEESFINFYEKYHNVKIDDLNYLSIDSEMKSIISTITMKNNPNMGATKYFKRGYVEVNYCLNKTIIQYRSSWELTTVKTLETAKISYEYEPFYITKNNGKLYLPDFLIHINNSKILLEIKGYVRGKTGKMQEDIKIESALNYCKKNNLAFIYLKKPLTDINQLTI